MADTERSRERHPDAELSVIFRADSASIASVRIAQHDGRTAVEVYGLAQRLATVLLDGTEVEGLGDLLPRNEAFVFAPLGTRVGITSRESETVNRRLVSKLRASSAESVLPPIEVEGAAAFVIPATGDMIVSVRGDMERGEPYSLGFHQGQGPPSVVPQPSVDSVRLSNDASRVAIQNEEGLVVFDHMGTKRYVVESGVDFRLSAEGEYLAVIDDGAVRLYRDTERDPQTFQTTGTALAVAFEGSTLAMLDGDDLHLADLARRESAIRIPLEVTPDDRVQCSLALERSPDALLVAAGVLTISVPQHTEGGGAAAARVALFRRFGAATERQHTSLVNTMAWNARSPDLRFVDSGESLIAFSRDWVAVTRPFQDGD